jgi:CRP-like cAMP-binding protein
MRAEPIGVTPVSRLDARTRNDFAAPPPLALLAGADGELAARVARRSASVVLDRSAARYPSTLVGAALLAVEEGFVVTSSEMALSRRIVLTTGRPGMLLAPPGPSERLEAVTPCRLTVLSSESLKLLLAHAPTAELIAEALIDALREREATIRNCAYVRHGERVREKLLQLGRVHGRVVPGGIRIDFPLTHQLLADMIGSARETVSIALAELARDGFVSRRQRRYVLQIGTDELLGCAC